MAKKTKKEVLDSSIIEEESPSDTPRVRRNPEPTPEPTVVFKAWYTMKMGADVRLKPHHLEPLRLYMRGLGLSENEPAKRFESGLSQYFGGN